MAPRSLLPAVKVMAPNARRETVRPVLPSSAYCMIGLLPGDPPPVIATYHNARRGARESIGMRIGSRCTCRSAAAQVTCASLATRPSPGQIRGGWSMMKRTIMAAVVLSLAVCSLALADPPEDHDRGHGWHEQRHGEHHG